ncbi:Oidioi.mRNA.OKI2018_I69.chr2.g7671.t1.cds [Oikopleura dioica]|uniref:Oidioi.mRNA.OKI2018_I69.chr2.g7671.t1.cds n=1 Tax=Oikopleura dioica TaxID=34765 RepID=A0ABN7TAI2_OIKDI|nr:Oidioi.mRNA.OKI2018_I69.chr2.g7671.t1.cds [Oikopleura dioica]
MSGSVEMKTAEALKLQKQIVLNACSTKMLWIFGWFLLLSILFVFCVLVDIDIQQQVEIQRLQQAFETFRE